MATFDAGSIESRLTLDRSAFTRELRAAREQARRFEANDINIDIDVNSKDLAAAAALMAALRDQDINVTANINPALVKLAQLVRIVKSLSPMNIDIDVSTAAAHAKVALLKQQIDSLDKLAKVGIVGGVFPTGGGNMNSSASHRALDGTRWLIMSILTLLPLIAPAATGATAVVVGLASGLTGAAGGAGVLGAAIFGVIQRFNQMKESEAGLNAMYQAIQDGLDGITGAWNAFIDATQADTIGLITQGLGILTGIIPRLIPIFESFAAVARGALDRLAGWVDGPEFNRMIDFFSGFGARAFEGFIEILGNVIRFLGYVFEAFGPFAEILINGIADMTDKWVAWAASLQQSKGFEDFINYVLQYGPQLLTVFHDLWDALVNIGRAVAPMAGPLMAVLSGIFTFIGSMDPTILGAIIAGLSTMIVLFQATAAAIALVNLVLAMNPFVLVAIAIAGLVAAIIYLWNTNEGFRNAIITAWEAIKNAIGVAVDAIVAAWDWIVAAGQAAWDWMVGFGQGVADVWNNITTWITTAATTIWEAIVTAFTAILTFWIGVWVAITEAVSTAWNWIVTSIQGGIAMLTAIWQAFWGVFGGVITAFVEMVIAYFTLLWTFMQFVAGAIARVILESWSLIFNTVRTVVSGIVAAVTTAWNWVRTSTINIWNMIVALMTTAWNNIRGRVQQGINFVRSIISAGWNWIRSTTASIWNAIYNAVVQPVMRFVNTVRSSVSGFTSALVSRFNWLRNLVTSAISGMVSAAQARFNNLVSAVSGLRSRIVGIFSGAASWLLNAGKNIIRGLLRGIESMIGAVTSKLRSVTNLIPDWKGPPDKDRKLLAPAGQMIMEGLVGGINDKIGPLRSVLSRITDMIGDVGGEGRDGINISRQVRASAPPAAGQGAMEITIHNYNPVEEKSSETTVRNMSELAVLGVFG